MVFQSARKRLLATLCYALVDPARREIQYASAGHLFPYRVTPEGDVESLESIAYPLGVRPTLEVVSRVAKLGPGDVVFLCSDGLVEARREGSEEHFGFERVERVCGPRQRASVMRTACSPSCTSSSVTSREDETLPSLACRSTRRCSGPARRRTPDLLEFPDSASAAALTISPTSLRGNFATTVRAEEGARPAAALTG
jgi:hypothetical protein